MESNVERSCPQALAGSLFQTHARSISRVAIHSLSSSALTIMLWLRVARGHILQVIRQLGKRFAELGVENVAIVLQRSTLAPWPRPRKERFAVNTHGDCRENAVGVHVLAGDPLNELACVGVRVLALINVAEEMR